MFHLKLLINLAPLSIAGQIDWHAPKVTTIWSGALPKQDLFRAVSPRR
jgi:hypothetical protein